LILFSSLSSLNEERDGVRSLEILLTIRILST